MANDRIGPVPAPTNNNRGPSTIEGPNQGMTYDGILGFAEVFTVNQDTGVCSRWDGSTGYPVGVTLFDPTLVDSNGDPVTLTGTPADGQPVRYCIFGPVGIKSACNADDTKIGTPYKGTSNGQVIQASAADATSTDKMVCTLLDFQDKNPAGGSIAWFFWRGYTLNTNKTS